MKNLSLRERSGSQARVRARFVPLQATSSTHEPFAITRSIARDLSWRERWNGAKNYYCGGTEFVA